MTKGNLVPTASPETAQSGGEGAVSPSGNGGAGPPLRFGSTDDHNLRLPDPEVVVVEISDYTH